MFSIDSGCDNLLNLIDHIKDENCSILLRKYIESNNCETIVPKNETDILIVNTKNINVGGGYIQMQLHRYCSDSRKIVDYKTLDALRLYRLALKNNYDLQKHYGYNSEKLTKREWLTVIGGYPSGYGNLLQKLTGILTVKISWLFAELDENDPYLLYNVLMTRPPRINYKNFK